MNNTTGMIEMRGWEEKKIRRLVSPSCLVLGFCGPKPVHVVCAIKNDPEELLLITVYDPSKRPDKWSEDYRNRR